MHETHLKEHAVEIIKYFIYFYKFKTKNSCCLEQICSYCQLKLFWLAATSYGSLMKIQVTF